MNALNKRLGGLERKKNESNLLELDYCYYYAVFSLGQRPKASACFFAFRRRSAILEFLEWSLSWCTAARAAKPSGYCG